MPERIACPFEVVVDTREQRDYDFGYVPEEVEEDEGDFYAFDSVDSGAARDHRLYDVRLRKAALRVGDYSIFGMPGVVVERKSKEDLFASVRNRANFEGRLARMMELDHAAVVIEAEWSEMVLGPPAFTRFTPKSLFRTILSWQREYDRVHWITCPGRLFAEQATFRILENYWKHNR